MDVALRIPDVVTRLIGGDGKLQCTWVGKSDILRSKTRHTACHIERILPRLQHPREPINCRIRV